MGVAEGYGGGLLVFGVVPRLLIRVVELDIERPQKVDVGVWGGGREKASCVGTWQRLFGRGGGERGERFILWGEALVLLLGVNLSLLLFYVRFSFKRKTRKPRRTFLPSFAL